MLKEFLLAALAAFAFSGNAAAQEVTVIGMGVDRDSAVKDAASFAVEQVAGTFIDSRTLMENLVIQLDEVYKKSRGFVKSIKILDEGFIGDEVYRVQALVDVDDAPNSALVDELTMIMQLNDPRIAVAAVGSGSARNKSVEGVLAESLISAGFAHILDSDLVFKNVDAATPEGFKNVQGIDYLVFCRCSENSSAVTIPDHYNTKKPVATDFKNIRTTLSVDVIKCDTGELIGNFSVEGTGVDNGDEPARRISVAEASKLAADKLTVTFKRFSARATQYLSFTLIAADASKLEKIIAELRDIGKVDNVRVRELSGVTAILAIDSAQKPYELVSILKNRTKLGVFVENMTNSSCTLRIN
ncbi:MAG: hypothetical protein J5809_06700 [Selenomonadaceae bacterium]|nr:hypothetical protein [Selenomonadaceae bacterium]